MKKDFDDLIHDKKIIQFLDKSIELFYDDEYPFLTYFGIDYRGSELLSVKLYVHAYKKISSEKLKDYFPFPELIEDYYQQFEEKKYSTDASVYSTEHELNNMGTLFKYKLDSKNNDSWTFFIRLKEYTHSPILNFKLIHDEPQLFPNYFSCEIKSGKPFYKRYYPISDLENRQFILNRFKLENIYVNEIGHMEYLEYENREKIAISFKGNLIVNYIDDEIKELSDFITEHYKFSPMGIGRCLKTKVSSFYFIDAAGGKFFKDSYTLLKLRAHLNEKVNKGN